MKNWIIVITFFSLWISTQLESQLQELLAYFLILTFGILHGANDILLIKSYNLKQGKALTLLHYISIMMVVVLLFLISKKIALLLFVLVSGYHFGEQHFEKAYQGNLIIGRMLYLFFGLSILFMIFFTKSDEVTLIINDLILVHVGQIFFQVGFLSCLTLFLLLLLLATFRKLLQVDILKEMFLLLVLFVVFKIASLSWAFAIYFVFWHSIPSIYDQLFFLYGRADKTTFIKYIKSSLIYWVASVVGLIAIYLLLANQVTYFITVLLYVLAAITFPHVLVMSRIESSKNSI